MAKFTKKMFREALNKRYAEDGNHEWVNPQGRTYKQLKRGYGDYLYAQDSEKFNVEYNVWVKVNGDMDKFEESV